MLNDILILDQQWLPNQSDFPPISWPWYRWPSPIMSGFHGAFATGVACQQGTLTLPDTWFRPRLWDVLVLQLLRPDSSNLPFLYSTFHLDYPFVLSRFCFLGSSAMWCCKFIFCPPLSRKRGDIKSHSSVCLSVRPSLCPSVCHKTLTLLIFSEVLIIEHWYLACTILVTSPFHWHHAVTLTFDLLQGQSCCRAGTTILRICLFTSFYQWFISILWIMTEFVYCGSILSFFVYVITNTQSTESAYSENNWWQDKKEEIWLSPVTNANTSTEKSKNASWQHKKRQHKLITQRLRTDLGRSVGVTTVTPLVWLNRFTSAQPSH